ncbi:ribosomal-protein-alanine acetyltransferase [Halalkalicoccus jeotgali B3]|uniref:Ribosomal-protein-alanine acetyltransferase n=1 Tax=Halalkalicoccus jeotgali (strain DSM 18796 / CECT 7217 / JCM 14584 / KCTC 4019 / B3) TaxID=795797 RepID=D8J7L3_HALJB|nr:ribosomal protein S18-alanine N-acetyltransferase [Halalkalicoccus jeotgali]ADJ16033.1 ribosomal-protein-alanine acetyltransferase [Halalkalicoccus jeotgali B3]ELY38129.1 ribosomal-protein-alanine acetyltransferase [Halalkalicoccus jeotgali B3]
MVILSETVSTVVTAVTPTSVRTATRADLLAIYHIEKASFPQPWPFSAFERFLGEPGFLVAWDDEGGVVGYVVADSVPNGGRAIGHVKDIAVAPDHRGEGIGRQLLSQALSILGDNGVGWVKLEVRDGNEPALSLYREFGFELRRRIPRYYADGETALVMVRPIEA